MGGNLINYPDDVGVPTANLLLIKIFLNSVISTQGAKFANANLANFYLMSPLKRPEYAVTSNLAATDPPVQPVCQEDKAPPSGRHHHEQESRTDRHHNEDPGKLRKEDDMDPNDRNPVRSTASSEGCTPTWH